MSRFSKFSAYLATSIVASSCQSVLSTEAMLSVLMNTESQTWNYVGRDVLGQLGGLLVMSGLTKHTDKNPQQFLWMSHAFQQVSMGLIMLSPSVAPEWFLPIGAVANVCLNVSFIGYGSINAMCVQRLSTEKNNVGELYSKFTMQTTLGSTVGLAAGMLLNEHLAHYSGLLFFGLGAVRIYCCNKAVRAVL